ncbi:MAG: ZIP family metal transporter [Patescibacteria group bacterium]
MTDPSLMTLLAVLIVSAVSLVGVAAFAISTTLLKRTLFALVGLAAGALLGDAIIHLIPESLEALSDERVFGITVLSGVLFFFILEKYLRWHHAHHGAEEEHEGHEHYEIGSHSEGSRAHIAPLVIIADGLHNAVDGAVIAGSFLISPALGIATTAAVFLHEIPQEISDYALLVHSGLSRGRALFLNFLSGLTAFLGALAVLLLNDSLEGVGAYAAAFTAGAFIYLAATDLIPELNRTTDNKRSILGLVTFLVGIGLMLALTLVEV